jgi:hypothetical protein
MPGQICVKKINFELFAPPARGWQAGKPGSLKLPKVSRLSSILAFQLPGRLIVRGRAGAAVLPNGMNIILSGDLSGF